MSIGFGKRSSLAAFLAAAVVLTACSGNGPRPAPVVEPAIADADGTAPALPLVDVPERAAAAYARALAAMRAQNFVEAELELEQLILEYTAFPGPYVNLAILYRRDGRDAEAERALTEALAIAPEHPAANNEQGVLHRERGEFDAAEAAYRRAIAGDPSYALAHYNLGVLLDVYLRRESDALEHYEAYQALLPEPDVTVGRWIIDLRRRLGLPEETIQIAREAGPLADAGSGSTEDGL